MHTAAGLQLIPTQLPSAPGQPGVHQCREETLRWIERCEERLEGFEEKVFAAQAADEAAVTPGEAGEAMDKATVRMLRPRRDDRRGRSASL